MRYFEATHGWWSLPSGALNTIADVPGVQVGHATVLKGSARTGVTAILPHGGDIFRQKLVAGCAILNGFGKSVGLMQLAELGQIETPILLSNTFAVPACATALIRRAIRQNPDIGRRGPTVNPLVLECNDGQINDIQAFHVTEELALDAINDAGLDVAMGTIGAGTGMKTFGCAGGVGSASRRVRSSAEKDHVLGAIVLSNFGQDDELRVLGQRLTPAKNALASAADKGSVILVFATDAPLDSRQLTRLARRSGAALGRLGSFIGNGSGDIAIAFSTANQIAGRQGKDQETIGRIGDENLDRFFLAAVEAAEEAVLNGLYLAESREGYDGLILPTLKQRMAESGLF